jgi:hypothetical protein
MSTFRLFKVAAVCAAALYFQGCGDKKSEDSKEIADAKADVADLKTKLASAQDKIKELEEEFKNTQSQASTSTVAPAAAEPGQV